jgi:hypothetical protein
MATTTETNHYQPHQPYDARSAAPVPEGDAAGGSRAALPQAALADALKKHPLWGNRAPRRALVPALALGLAVSVGLGGYAWHRANPTEAQAPWMPAATAAGAATPASGTVPPTFRGADRVQDNPPEAFTLATLRPKAHRRHGYRHLSPVRPQPQPTFWQQLFGHNAQNQPG